MGEVESTENVDESVEFSERKNQSLRARYVYGSLFLLTNVIAWLFRDYGQRILPFLPYSKACGPEGRECYQTMGVLRLSCGCFIFFFIMFVTTCFTRKLHDPRSGWHSGCWSHKFFLLLISFTVPFFVPSFYILLYGEVARVGAGVFLILQLISVIEFITWWNNYWMSDETRKSGILVGLCMSIAFYVGSVSGIVAMYIFYASKNRCSLNIFFISWTGILLLVMMGMSLHSKMKRGLLSSGIMASYIVFLCWTAIRSEPESEKCSPQKQKSSHSHGGWATVLTLVIDMCAIVLATFSTGIDYQSFQFFKQRNLPRADDQIPYGYGFFHTVFSIGSMYFAMLFLSWNLGSLTKKWIMDVGWASTWVKIINISLAAAIYSEVPCVTCQSFFAYKSNKQNLTVWKLIFPAVRETKVSNHEEEKPAEKHCNVASDVIQQK